MFKRQLFRKVITLGISSVIGFTALGFGQASAATDLVIGTETYASPTIKFAIADAAAESKIDQLISVGTRYLGVRYQFGAAPGNTQAFDCSSYTQYIFKQIGIALPRTSSSQAHVGTWVAKSDLKAGDLVFFKRPGKSGIGHVAIYIGNDQMIGASGDEVQISSLNTSYWKRNYVTARRVL